jgi:hypothetical protein
MSFINKLLNFTPSEEWIRKESKLAWLKLNIQVPADEIYLEWTKVKQLAVDHRDGERVGNLSNKGWKSLTIYGISPVITNRSDGVMAWTSVADQCPITKKWIDDNFIIDETTQRIRFMLLEPGGYILPHCDRDFSGLGEVNVAVHQPNNCWFKFLNNGIIPFQPGDAYIIDTSNKHMVVNDSEDERLHIILHTKTKSGIIKESYASCYHNR